MNLLFISHDGHRGGATIYLLWLLTWITRNTEYKVTVFLRKDGEIRKDFEELCTTFIERKKNKNSIRSWIRNKIEFKRSSQIKKLEDILKTKNFDLAYLNTIANGDLVPILEKYNIPFVTHIHELETGIQDHGKGMEKIITQKSSSIICVSDAATKNLIKLTNTEKNRIHTIQNFIQLKEYKENSKIQLRSALLSSIKIPSQALVIGFCGLGILRKGIDLAIPLANIIPKSINGRDTHYIWVGNRHQEYSTELSNYDIEKSGLKDRFHFIGPKVNAREWMQTFDVHALLSREESFGLVVLETANYSIPTVCFDKAGGASEFVRNDAGLTVPYLDLQAMAEAITELLQNQEFRYQQGKNAYSRLTKNNTPDIVAPKIIAVLDQVLKSKNPNKAKNENL